MGKKFIKVIIGPTIFWVSLTTIKILLLGQQCNVGVITEMNYMYYNIQVMQVKCKIGLHKNTVSALY